jgi:hypothetical protein
VRVEPLNGIAKAVGGVATGIRARPGLFVAVTISLFVLNLFLPVVVLSIARRPVDFFTFNPWLSRLPEYLLSDEASLARKLEFLSNMAIAWFSADNPVEGVEWGYVVDVPSLAWMGLTSILFGAYFAVWAHLRRALARPGAATRSGARAGIAGGVTSVFGISTGPCSVAGCGVPVLPIIGLAITGVSTETLRLLATTSRVAVAVVIVAATLGTAWLGWLVSASARPEEGPGADNLEGGLPVRIDSPTGKDAAGVDAG